MAITEHCGCPDMRRIVLHVQLDRLVVLALAAAAIYVLWVPRRMASTDLIHLLLVQTAPKVRRHRSERHWARSPYIKPMFHFVCAIFSGAVAVIRAELS